jgi:hypothetical protein
MNALFLALLAPVVAPGGSAILGWLLTLCIIAVIVWFVVWLVTKFAGPPVIPEPVRWVIWVIVAIALLIFIFAALGIKLP